MLRIVKQFLILRFYAYNYVEFFFITKLGDQGERGPRGATGE